MILYHGSQAKNVTPTYGLGATHHDFGAGFYLTDAKDLAREWAVYTPNGRDGFVHAYELNLDGLKVHDFRNSSVLAWVAELMKHRDASDTDVYRRRAREFVRKYAEAVEDADVIVGWRADASYFYIVKMFVRDEVGVECMPELLHLGGFGLQYVLKSSKAYSHLKIAGAVESVEYAKYHAAYEERDLAAREKMRDLIADANFNRLERLFTDTIKEAAQ